eukprot:m.112556 g.112556  ORF g.112556 m.112556 type:complete len:278 (-) comp28198_c2_seq1:402-1235(-)
MAFSSICTKAVSIGIVSVLLLGVTVSVNAECEYTDPVGNVNDVSALTNAEYYSVDSENYNSFKFFFNICGAISWADGSTTCPTGTTGCCEVQILGGQDTPSELYGKSADYRIEYVEPENEQAAGPVVIMEGNECPRGDPGLIVQTRIYLVCNPEADEPIIKMIEDNYWECFVHIKMQTKHACGASESFIEFVEEDVGMVLCILLFVFLGLYFAIGFGVLHKQGMRGWERMPQKSFWEALPGLIKDGAQYSKEKTMNGVSVLKEKINARRGGGSYDKV